jgi:hypothetical protein
LPEIWAEPLQVVVEALTRHATVQEVAANLPDVDLMPSTKPGVERSHWADAGAGKAA